MRYDHARLIQALDMHPTDLEGRDRQQVPANLNSFRTSKGRDIVHSKRTIDQDSVSKKKTSIKIVPSCA
jgi:hypothetical protein